jgi:hypothetical protein
MSHSTRDHLFISYATEDAMFAEWLALRLTSEGYKVWCDQIKLLGGESYPRDIDAAIKTGTFRLLAVLSRSSISKPNPLKERTLALNLSRERDEEFLIPLNLDGVRPAEMDWMVSDITFVPFYRGWAGGLAQLLKLLHKIDAPKSLSDGRSLVAKYVDHQSSPAERQERLWSNVLAFKDVPETLIRVAGKSVASRRELEDWPHYRENSHVCWMFETPPEMPDDTQVRELEWADARAPSSGLPLRNVAVNLLKQYLEIHCLTKGLRCWEDGKRRRHLYFASSEDQSSRLPFVRYDGTKSWVRSHGWRTFKTVHGLERVQYHLEPNFLVLLTSPPSPAVLVRLRVFLTDDDGNPLPVGTALRRRKAICKTWWNYEWYARCLAIVQWLTGGNDVDLALTEGCRIRLGGTPVSRPVPVGIDEGLLVPTLDAEDQEIEDEDEGGGDD